MHKLDSEGLRQHLADRDTCCPGCGYNLRGLVGEVCPECGKPVVLPRVGRWRRFTSEQRLFVSGVMFGTAVVVLWVAVIIGLTLMGIGGPLNLIALWVPIAMAFGIGILIAWGWAVWQVAEHIPWLAWLNGCLAWALGGSYFIVPVAVYLLHT